MLFSHDLVSYDVIPNKIVERSHEFLCFIDLPGVLDPDLDVEIVEAEIIVRALRTLPETKLLTCRIACPAEYSPERPSIRFEWGVLEIRLSHKEGA